METRAPYAQGEFFFPGEGGSVFREGAGELLDGIIQLNYTYWVNVACNQTEGHHIGFYFCFLVALRHFASKRKAELNVWCWLTGPVAQRVQCSFHLPFTNSQSTSSGDTHWMSTAQGCPKCPCSPPWF